MIWAYRNMHDVVNSNLNRFSTQVETCRLLLEDDASDWRSEGVSAEVRALVAQHYHPEMSREDAAALFWYARNAIYLEQELENHPRVYLWNYDQFVREPEINRLYDFLGVRPAQLPLDNVSDKSVGLGQSLSIKPAIADACESLEAQIFF